MQKLKDILLPLLWKPKSIVIGVTLDAPRLNEADSLLLGVALLAELLTWDQQICRFRGGAGLIVTRLAAKLLMRPVAEARRRKPDLRDIRFYYRIVRVGVGTFSL